MALQCVFEGSDRKLSSTAEHYSHYPFRIRFLTRIVPTVRATVVICEVSSPTTDHSPVGQKRMLAAIWLVSGLNAALDYPVS